MNAIGRLSVFLIVVPCVACAGLDRDSSKELGQAGQAVAQSVLDQETLAVSRLANLPTWMVMREVLQCSVLPLGYQEACIRNAEKPSEKEAENRARVSESARNIRSIMAKRAEAAKALVSAYAAFTAFATIDAQAQTKAAVTDAAKAIDSFGSTVAHVVPSAVVVTAALDQVSAILGDITGIIASERQRAGLLAASKALRIAVESFATNLKAERDYAAKDLFVTLELESGVLFQSFAASGVVSPIQVLAPVVHSVAPADTALSIEPASITARAAARIYLDRAVQSRANDVGETYARAIAGLQSLADKHRALEVQASVDVLDLLAQAKLLSNDIKSLSK